MKRNWLLWGCALVVTLGLSAHAETGREEMAHAYRLLKGANADYAGHRVKAMEHLRAAGQAVGLKLEGDAPEHERQWKSDQQVAEAGRLLRDARQKLEAADRNRGAALVDKAIAEIDLSLKAVTETAREELVHAYRLLSGANAHYAGHRVKAMEELHAAGLALALKLEGDAPERERQWKADEQLAEARRLLQEARGRLQAEDRDRVAARVEKAITEIDLALKVR